MKPGEVTNRGHGISVESELKDIENILNKKELHKNGNPKTYIMYNILKDNYILTVHYFLIKENLIYVFICL